MVGQIRMQENHIKVAKTARYFQLGEVGSEIREVWFVCHGYGQNADHFLKHFEFLDNGARLIIAPEGLSRFYLNGFSGRIGASWMTRVDRLNDIKDYVLFLDAIYQQIFEKLDRSSVKVSALGFSQGTATASRWLKGTTFDGTSASSRWISSAPSSADILDTTIPALAVSVYGGSRCRSVARARSCAVVRATLC